MKNQGMLSVFALFLFFFALSWALLKPVRPSEQNLRRLASISPSQNKYNYSALIGGSLDEAIKNHIVDQTEILQNGSDVKIRFAHFSTRGGIEGAQSACGVYQKIEFVFFAEGVAVSGQPPQIRVKSPCDHSSLENNYFVQSIPIAELMNRKPSAVGTEGFRYNRAEISIENFDGFWPENWLLHEIRLIPLNGKDISIPVLHESNRKDLAHKRFFIH